MDNDCPCGVDVRLIQSDVRYYTARVQGLERERDALREQLQELRAHVDRKIALVERRMQQLGADAGLVEDRLGAGRRS
jgi:uncharacterized protein YlxW (UPF0749 family)